MHYIGFQNGIFLPQSEMIISVHDRGYLYGETLFETCLWSNNTCEYFYEHWVRWNEGMKLMKLLCKYSQEEFKKIVEVVIQKNKISTGIIRWTISYDQLRKQSNICLTVREHVLDESEGFNRISLKVSEYVKPNFTPFHRCKQGNYLLNMQEFRNAKNAGFNDVLFLNQDGYVAETAIANIFWKKDEVFYTPSLDVGVLPGIIRQKIIEKSRSDSSCTKEGCFKIESLLSADYVFITNCVKKIVSVKTISFQNRSIGFSTKLMKGFL